MDVDEYDKMAAAATIHWWYESTRTLLRQLVEPHLRARTGTGMMFLDAGGGSGATGSWLAEFGPTVVDDFEPSAVAVAADRYSGYVGVCADINHMPHPPDTFDVSLCVTALCHRMNPDPQVVVDELARVTKPGGLVVLMEPGVRRLRRGHDEVTHTACRFSKSDLVALLAATELDIVRATGAYTFLVPPAALLGLIERGEPNSDVGRNESGLGGLFGLAARGERALLRRINLPFGLSVIAIGMKR